MKIQIINGPNLNLTGVRETSIYGTTTFETFIPELKKQFSEHVIEYFQSNIEGEIINKLHATRGKCDGIIINPAGYSHTSVAIADAVAAMDCPVIEVHLSNIFAREDFRETSITGRKAKGVITGFGLTSYKLAVTALENCHTETL